ncbi:MAG TPA: sugar phosphate isomerase/epimerase family protein [Candidatus Methylomirabilis sp.]|nr:sugar phosphate isomerase/epimerase family protein [Candidatus Methylomirabilis sp.]
MRIGAHAQIWVAPFTGNTLDLVGRVRDLGFDAIDINVGELPPPFQAAELRRRLTESHLQGSLGAFLTAQRDITSGDAGVRRTGVEFLRGVARLCGEVGAKTFIGPMHSEIRRQHPDPAPVREERWKRCVEGLAAVAREAEQVGIHVAVEVLNRYESDFLTTTADGVRLCHAVGNPRLGLLLDTFHMNIEEQRIGDAFRSAAGHVYHVHTCENDRGAPGGGHLDWVEVRNALRDIGYDGVCTIESYNPDLPMLAQRTSFWRPVASGPDELAREGLAFLRRLFGSQ